MKQLSPVWVMRPSRGRGRLAPEFKMEIEMSGSIADFHRVRSDDLFEKCTRFSAYRESVAAEGLYQAAYRLELLTPLDHRVIARDPFTGRARELICFDSNSYLGLHLHPKVVAATRAAIGEAGYGTPSAQLLAGTNRWLRELEETVAEFHGRPQTLIFPSGYAANIGILTGLLRPGDAYAIDRLSHASIHDGCRWSGAKGGTFEHGRPGDAPSVLASRSSGLGGRLIASDGVFSMHGRLARLPELVAAARGSGAKLMIDEAHSVGVVGPGGRGIEEHFSAPGSVDILMGTFSKAPGAVGGYVCGGADLIEYLRFFARANMFTASLPAATCAGIAEAFRIMASESEHRERLWENARRMHRMLGQTGFAQDCLESPILTVQVGSHDLAFRVGRDLFDAGIKCGIVGYPAVPKGESLLRFSVNARHSAEDIERTVEALGRIARKRGFLSAEISRIHPIDPRKVPAPAASLGRVA